MKKQSNSSNTAIKNQQTTSSGSQQTSTNKSEYIYTEADLGENILEISLGTRYNAAKSFTNPMYGKASYAY